MIKHFLQLLNDPFVPFDLLILSLHLLLRNVHQRRLGLLASIGPSGIDLGSVGDLPRAGVSANGGLDL